VPSTTVHFERELLDRIDDVAARRGVSRNRFIAEACRRALEEDAGTWPEDFFDPGFSDEDWKVIREATRELEQVVMENRHNRGAPLL